MAPEEFTTTTLAYNPSVETHYVREQTARETTVSHPKTHKGKIQQLPEPLTQILSPMDREARVLGYREKKKKRKFEKTIREKTKDQWTFCQIERDRSRGPRVQHNANV
ncbi:unnamed protein product [Eruca vesicaria subsp. sativa]|uniref:Uncharacterized protein n=1 Tax=Eruca vesicaria subsp. sativa TaxID=29727 RepID=A0ABC8K006_ERUVS|nr:unnamed protein product [Eruca vesicaria subsp. sativa]